MRTLTGTEITLLAGPVYRVTPRIKVANGSGTMIDLTTWFESLRIERDIDQPVSGATVEFRRDYGALSLAPLRADSILNRDDTGNYSPQMDPGRAFTIEIATTAFATPAVDADYRLKFDGTLDIVNWERSPLAVSARDKGGALVDRWIETEKIYASTGGLPVEVVMQEILTDVFGIVNPVTLYVPVSPGFMVLRYLQKKQSVMDALFTLAQLIGWDVRYKFDNGTGTFRLTLSQPPRTKTIPDYTFGPAQYLDITTMMIDRTNIRNVISGSFLNASTRARMSVVVQDSVSIARYGRRYFELQEGDDSPIDSSAEATTLVNSVLADLKDPKAEHELETHFFYAAELNDLYRQSPNAVHYNSNQDYAAVNIIDDLTPTKHRTTIKTRGSPAGAYETWHARHTFPFPQPDTALALNDFKVVAEDDTTITYGWVAGGLVDEVWAADILFTEPMPADPWSYVLSAIAPLPVGTTTYTVQKVVEGQIRLIQVEPRDTNLTPGAVRRVTLNHAPTQLPSIELDDIETATTGTQWWKITERGLAVTAVEVQTQVGTEPITPFGPPTRSAGDISLVRGGTLGTGEYEHDVTLDATRFSWIMPRLTLSNGAPPKTLGPFGFDRDKRPNLISISVTGTIITILADSDTKSIKVVNSGGTWVYQVDGVSLVVDVSKTGTNGAAGLGGSSSDTYTITAQSDPLAYVDVATLSESSSVTIGGATAPPATATWDSPGVSLAAPPTIGSDVATITLKATSAPVGWTTQVFIYIGFSSSGTPTVNHTADLTPALSTPPIVSTDYTYATANPKSAHTTGTALVTMKVRADLKDGGGIVRDTKTVQATWYSPL